MPSFALNAQTLRCGNALALPPVMMILRSFALGFGSLSLGFLAAFLFTDIGHLHRCHHHDQGHGPPVVVIAGNAQTSPRTPVTVRRSRDRAYPVREIRPAPDPHMIVDITRAAFDHYLERRPLAAQARLVPRLVSGKSIGVKLYSIRPNSLFSVLGLRNGDVLQTVNSMDVLGDDYPMGLYAVQHASSFLDFGLLRDGVPTRIVVLIHDRAASDPLNDPGV